MEELLPKPPKSSIIFGQTVPPDIQNLLQETAGSFDMKTVVAGIFFSLVGFSAWRYGRHSQSGRHMILAVVLMAYPYFVPGFWWSLLVGSSLTVFLFWP